MERLKPPVLVIGATRSGTSVLAELLGSAPGACLWYEPNPLWRVGTAYRGHDGARPEDASPFVRWWIRRQFLKYQRAHGGARIVEKSPTNVLRIGFVHRVFPESKIIHIYRDGRANLRSQVEKYETFAGYSFKRPEDRGRLTSMLRAIPPWEIPAYLPRALAGMWRRHVLKKPGVAWFGLRYPGWKKDRGELTVAQIAAKQWVVAVETALKELSELPRGAWMGLRYRDLVSEPHYWFRRIADFCEMELPDEALEEIASQVHRESLGRWRTQLSPEVLEETMPIMEPTLRRLGYLEDDADRVASAG